MPRRLRCADGGYVYHVLNRAVGRATLFHKAGRLRRVREGPAASLGTLGDARPRIRHPA